MKLFMLSFVLVCSSVPLHAFMTNSPSGRQSPTLAQTQDYFYEVFPQMRPYDIQVLLLPYRGKFPKGEINSFYKICLQLRKIAMAEQDLKSDEEKEANKLKFNEKFEQITVEHPFINKLAMVNSPELP